VHSKRRRSTLSCVASHNAAIVLQRVNTYTADPGLHHLYHRPPPPPPVQQIPAGTRRPGVDGSLERGVGAPGSGISSPEIELQTLAARPPPASGPPLTAPTSRVPPQTRCLAHELLLASSRDVVTDERAKRNRRRGVLLGGATQTGGGHTHFWVPSLLVAILHRLSEVIFVMHSAKQDAFCVFGIAIGDTLMKCNPPNCI
jgi:hypothetical protein